MGARRKVVVGVVAALLVAGGIAGVVVLRTDGSGTTASPTGPPVPAQPGALVVKVDNAPAARPQTGIGAADVVYVEPVEGGTTRLAAVYWSGAPTVVGPVRSARETDLELLAQYGEPVLAYSGSAPELVSLIEDSTLVRASPEDVGEAYMRDDSRIAPYNLYVRPDRLPEPEAGAAARVLPDGPAPPGGRPATVWTVTFESAVFDLAWSAGTGRWAISVDGAPFTSTDSGPVEAASVVVQQVSTRAGQFVEDVAGAVSPVAVTVGSGAAVVLRDGAAFDATWSRPDAGQPTRFTTADGTELPVAPGRVWVFLVPV